ncbi:AraC family transcriptional regulator [Massilia sp. KIM]|uniref:AraC family transcriptional regulator n=1 Tax=Massilia sp. KIM TaxID=1955422 RepID=UPI0009902922|nr:AraC family transcriptional regulator [Massilia sp. KIM]OON61302.1 AraC family transcriptional regulator [Massilia sp. KIM]
MLDTYNFSRWFRDGHEAPYVRERKSPGGVLDMLDLARPSGEVSHPSLPELVMFQDQTGGSRVSGNAGLGYFNVMSEPGAFYMPAPNYAHTVMVDGSHRLRGLSFSFTQWQGVLDEATEGRFSIERLLFQRGFFLSPLISIALQNLWSLSEEEGAPSRLLARAAGCEILAELCRLSGARLAPVNGGLAPSVRRRCIELMRTRMSEDLGLDELAAEAGLSVFHFARMFKQSVGMPPRVYLTQLRMERAAELLQSTELSMTEIANELGYSSSQVLARIFLKHYRRSPTDYRRVVRMHT